MFGISHSIAEDLLEENLQDSSCLFVDETRHSLDPTASCQPTDGWLVIPWMFSRRIWRYRLATVSKALPSFPFPLHPKLQPLRASPQSTTSLRDGNSGM